MVIKKKVKLRNVHDLNIDDMVPCIDATLARGKVLES